MTAGPLEVLVHHAEGTQIFSYEEGQAAEVPFGEEMASVLPVLGLGNASIEVEVSSTGVVSCLAPNGDAHRVPLRLSRAVAEVLRTIPPVYDWSGPNPGPILACRRSPGSAR